MTYQGIRERMQITSRRSTIITLDITRHAVKRITGHLPTDATIWHSIRSKDITRTIRVFLWKLIHGTHKCGGSRFQTLSTVAFVLSVEWKTQ
jgi:hypothetical protein